MITIQKTAGRDFVFHPRYAASIEIPPPLPSSIPTPPAPEMPPSGPEPTPPEIDEPPLPPSEPIREPLTPPPMAGVSQGRAASASGRWSQVLDRCQSRRLQ